ncbi:NADH:ubiquinone oxidoreductase subunit M [Streptomyces avermitilis]|uniref:NADH dehydrogenase I chain M (Complex I) n=2 Tax=Streptomyces avermitilis TaxID=33903 RepID=Q82DW9_STRAW|nr:MULTISPECIES: NADH-quinone oxidoreductase subunit M [Streptomyces]KUN52544.1 NADH:ubiquinone oxidoreductase subunit M [Streptomyces avermitilis]MYT00432.1 NADH-quinone oxidoreductase subunit M [Streptomyces sp. SID5469]OOV31393.1 NADH-quinone oxidoreductase subunit M [Streptomyces avermitilis]BAC72561.1 putative NADH dehydrogenase I chain M (complex I) [Streptomyces avermitilis MA-4680 = NBRC 14893]BBJ52922.1 NADH-quinone oxidoreductase subunit M [Streptomyces avermitilis]
MSFPLLTATAVLPALGALATAAVPAARRTAAKWLALAVSLATLVLAAVVLVRFEPGGARYQLTESHPWIKDFGVRYELGVDGIGVALVALTALLIPFIILAGWHDADPLETRSSRWRPTQGFFALILAVEAMVILSFEATDVFLFYIFFEAMLIPMYFLIGGFGDRAHGAYQSAVTAAQRDEAAATQRSYAAVKFLLYNLVGGLIMLAAVIGLYVVAGNFSLQEIVQARANGSLHMATSTERWLFLGFFFAFAVKAPLWPLHTWLPNAMGESTAPVAVLITAVVDKVGTFAMLRFCLGLFPEASKWATPVILVLALISIVYGALLAVGQRDIKRLVAYASISHFGFIVLGIFAMTSQGQSGATLYMVNHGISTAALMLVAGFLISRRGSRLIADYGGVQKVAPVLAGTFLIGGLATLSLPGLAPFVSEFLVLVGTFTRYPAVGIIATFGIVLAALYTLVLYQRTMTGPVKAEVAEMPDLRARELLVVAPLIALLIFLGVYPKPVTDIVNPAVQQTMSDVHEKDPKPEVEAAK